MVIPEFLAKILEFLGLRPKGRNLKEEIDELDAKRIQSLREIDECEGKLKILNQSRTRRSRSDLFLLKGKLASLERDHAMVLALITQYMGIEGVNQKTELLEKTRFMHAEAMMANERLRKMQSDTDMAIEIANEGEQIQFRDPSKEEEMPETNQTSEPAKAPQASEPAKAPQASEPAKEETVPAQPEPSMPEKEITQAH